MTFSRKILVGLGAGVAVGLTLGEYVFPLKIVAARTRRDPSGPNGLSRRRTARGQSRAPGLLLLQSAVPQGTERGAPGKGFGYTNVRVLSAGISGWLDASLPTESGA